MILDRLQNASRYCGLSPRIAAAFRWLAETDCLRLPVGRVEIDGDHIYALVQDNITKQRSHGVWEAHRKYIDVQYVAAGAEEMGYANIGGLYVKVPYDAEKDFALFEGTGTFVLVSEGSFTVFFPEDGHIPGCAVGDVPAPVRKVVVKVAV